MMFFQTNKSSQKDIIILDLLQEVAVYIAAITSLTLGACAAGLRYFCVRVCVCVSIYMGASMHDCVLY